MDNRQRGLTISIPISDTIPGPGNIQFHVESYEDWQNNYFLEDPAGSETLPGAGTAYDVPSTGNTGALKQRQTT